MQYAVTILTRPVLPRMLNAVRHFRNQRRITQQFKCGFSRNFGGHTAVTRSLCDGLRCIGVSYNCDPKNVDEVCKVVFCISDPRSLRQAIRWKRHGKVKKVFAGFTILGSLTDRAVTYDTSEIDGFVCASDWFRAMLDLLFPGFKAQSIAAPSGVDATYWSPHDVKIRKQQLVFYKKWAPHNLYDRCLQYARENGYDVQEINYGDYELQRYRKLLLDCSALVHWVDHETQGISVAEAWASDVPTLVWNPGFVFLPVLGKNHVFECSSSPYLTEATGTFFRDFNEFTVALRGIGTKQSQFSPRQWVLDNMTDSICAERVSNYLLSLKNA